MDELKHIRTFIKAVEAGSFSAAARDSSSISSVARQIKALETEVGARLLHRNSRTLSMTEAGLRLYERAQDIVNRFDTAVAEVRSLHEGVNGVLRVALRVSACTTVVMPALPKFLAQYPELVVDITLTDERLDLIADKIDVAIWMGDLPDSGLVARRLAPTGRVVCGAPAYLDAHGVPIVPGDLARQQCIVFRAPSYGNVWTFHKDGERQDIEVHGSVVADNGLVLLRAAELGLGLVVMPEWMVRAHLEKGQLVRVLGDYRVEPHSDAAPLFAIFPTSRGMSRKVRLFVDFLIDTFKDVNSDRTV